MKNDNKDDKYIETGRFKRGTILLSSPLLNDPNFKRTAILLLDEESSGGHIGLVLNRPLDITLADVCSMPGKYAAQPVHHGGPVDLQRLFWLHNLGDRLPGSLEILPGLYVGGDYDALIKLFAENEPQLDHKIRFYLGYSGWGKGQLQAETEAGAWGLLPMLIDSNLILDLDGEELWHQLCLLLSSDYRHWRMIPADPNLN